MMSTTFNVPAEPSEAIIRAGMERLGWWTTSTPPEYESGGSALISHGLSEEEAEHIFIEVYKVILAAAGPESKPLWRLFSEERPVAVSYLARFFDNELGEWVFTVLDPGPLNITVAAPYTHWMPLNELLPRSA